MSPRRKVMLVDDDQAIVQYLAAKLGKLYDIVSTTEPLRALALARAERPDVVLCDIDMPEMSGGDVAAALAGDAQTQNVPLIYLTTLVSPEETEELHGLVGGRPGISKRARVAELVALIDDVTAGGPAA